MSRFKSKLTRKLALAGYRRFLFGQNRKKKLAIALEAQRLESESNRRRLGIKSNGE